MRTKRWIKWLLVAAVIAWPLAFAAGASAESGCHRNGGSSNGPVSSQTPPQ